MKSIEESVVMALDGTDTELFPFLPYILQDLWEIGASPEAIIDLVKKHTRNYSSLRILDLGCGKGIVSIKLAEELKCSCFGIDAVKEFIDDARKKARELKVNHLCQFEVNDLRQRVKTLSQFDVIILGAIGPVLGDYYYTLTILSKCLKQNGIIIIDDSYIENDNNYTHPLVQKKSIILEQINQAGMKLIDEIIFNKDEIISSDEYIFENLKKRCDELIEKYPDKRTIFENYIKHQEEENEALAIKVACVTMVISNKNRIKE